MDASYQRDLAACMAEQERERLVDSIRRDPRNVDVRDGLMWMSAAQAERLSGLEQLRPAAVEQSEPDVLVSARHQPLIDAWERDRLLQEREMLEDLERLQEEQEHPDGDEFEE